MDISTYIVSVFTFVDDWFQQQAEPLRRRGPRPVLWDSEVVTMEVVGAFLGLSTDQALYSYFCRHWVHYFPRLSDVHRTTFVRQAANLWQVKERLWRALLSHTAFDPDLAMVDSMPVPICRFARASYARRLRDCAAYGHDEVARQKFLGLRAHLVVCWPGVITGLELAPANVAELTVAEHLLDGHRGWVVADRNYWSPNLRARLRDQGKTGAKQPVVVRWSMSIPSPDTSGQRYPVNHRSTRWCVPATTDEPLFASSAFVASSPSAG